MDHRADRHSRAAHCRTEARRRRPRHRCRRRQRWPHGGIDCRARSTSSSLPPRRRTTPSRRPRPQVQAALGITGGAAFDLQAVCSGFVYALTIADSLLQRRAGRATALVDRVGDLLAHSRLVRTARPACCSATAPGRWCCGPATAAASDLPSAAFIAAASAPMGATTTSSMSMAGHPPPRRSGICAWRAGRCSSMPSSTSRT